MKPIPTLTLFLFCTGFFFSCQKNSDPVPNEPPSYDFSQVDQILTDSVPVEFDGKCFVMIDVDGQNVYSRGFGGYTADTRQLIASCSKWMSAGVIMSLVDDGTLRLTDTVGKYLPVFTAYGKGNITISQLFSHTSGFTGHSTQGYEMNQSLTLEQAVDSIARNVPLLYTPGAGFYYGGVSMQVGGRICEVASGKTWKELFAERIATPCGMTSTDFGPTPNPIIAGGLRSTPNDYMKFLNMIMTRGLNASGTRVLSASSIDAMEISRIGSAAIVYSPYPPSLLQTSQFYGTGNWRDATGPGDVLIENSSPGKFGSHPWINRGKKMTGFIFTYVAHTDDEISPTVYTCLKIRELCRSIIQ
jgi:CubicO group peptidase (beta-lactamase class C family)